MLNCSTRSDNSNDGSRQLGDSSLGHRFFAVMGIRTLDLERSNLLYCIKARERKREGRRPSDYHRSSGRFPKIALPRCFSTCKPIGVFRPELDCP